ncbi:MAG TPA: hypothetical protein PKZ16_00400 [bacterium]|nr:hypothetical protein [bacterium]HPL95874.1 hypothetical protein [bacterium]
MKEVRILLVDDEELYRKSFKMGLSLLHRHGIEPVIFEAGDLETALGILNFQSVGLVLTDGIFPAKPDSYIGDGHGNCTKEDFHGNEVAAEARRLGVKVIGISSEPKLFHEVNVVFKKPVDLMELIQKIVELLK